MATWLEMDELFIKIRRFSTNNKIYFETNESSISKYFAMHFSDILKNTNSHYPYLKKLSCEMYRFDYDSEHKGNGYRSMFNYYKRILDRLFSVIDKITQRRTTFFFDITKHELCNELRAWTKLMEQFGEIIKMGNTYLENAVEGDLFIPLNETTNAVALEAFDKIVRMDTFLDRPLGFQFTGSLLLLLNAVVCLTAACNDFPDIANESYTSIAYLVTSAYKYMFCPELRAKKAYETMKNADVAFCKALSEFNDTYLMKKLLQVTIGKVALNKRIYIKEKCIQISESNMRNYGVTPFSNSLKVHLPLSKKDVQVKCITHTICDSALENLNIKEDELETRTFNKSNSVDTIMFHIHGGGFIANNSVINELYLRTWARKLGIPIFSVEYSLAPEAVFPLALEECYYGYVWMLENKPLGWSGKAVVMAGDSAGGNLITSLVVKCILTNVKVPDALFSFYPVLNVVTRQSPSRLLSVVDPLLNYCMTQNCCMAYCGIDADDLEAGDDGADKSKRTKSKEEDNNNRNQKYLQAANRLKRNFIAMMNFPHYDNPLMSPVFADMNVVKHFPYTYIFASECDPLLDDSVTFAKLLRDVGVKHEFLIFKDLPHGFLSLPLSSSHTSQVAKRVTEILENVIKSLVM